MQAIKQFLPAKDILHVSMIWGYASEGKATNNDRFTSAASLSTVLCLVSKAQMGGWNWLLPRLNTFVRDCNPGVALSQAGDKNRGALPGGESRSADVSRSTGCHTEADPLEVLKGVCLLWQFKVGSSHLRVVA